MQRLSSAAVMIGTLRVKNARKRRWQMIYILIGLLDIISLKIHESPL